MLKDSLNNLYIASARAGNVIGGGDWAENGIVPDCVRALKNKNKIIIKILTVKDLGNMFWSR